MVSRRTVELAGVIMTVGIVAMSGTNLAFAQQPSCGEQAYGYIGCTPLNTAQLYGSILVAGVVALAIGCGAAGVRYHTIP
ncbi:MAG: hypothetical protein KGH88_02925 [Thaumarchaeota archaeon]|nr:hypothetical protein [Nitrososphaerota archaeon]